MKKSPYKLGLTGSIGMGKSTTARLFQDAGCAVWDADAAVHRLYAKGGAAVAVIAKLLPDAVVDGAVSRDMLKKHISDNPTILREIEQIVHPLVAKDRIEFLRETDRDIAVLDIPLLFETGSEKFVDSVVCVSVAPEIQRARVLERGTMTEQQFEAILAKQLPDAEKRRRSDYVIWTDTLERAQEQVQAIVIDIRGKLAHA